MSTQLSERIAEFVCRGGDDRVSAAARRLAVRSVLDTLAVTMAGGADDAVRKVERSLEPAADGACPSPWSNHRYTSADAALLYGMASHMHDYDDVSMLAICHPSAPVLSAMLAAQFAGMVPEVSEGSGFVDALVIGTEVSIRIGQAMGFRHYDLGFHATGTLGMIGAAAAVARLSGLDEVQTRHALAIAASMASGLRKNFGSMVKPLHVGLAASGGLRAVRMALAGVQGAREAFESGGYLKAFSGGQTDAFSSDLSFGSPFAIESPGFEQKRYPCCYMVHKTIEATLQARRANACSLDDLRSAHVQMAQGASAPLIHPYPQSGLNGKFSAPYAVIASLEDGRVDLASFTDAAVIRPRIQQRLRDVVVEETSAEVPPGSDLGRMPVTVTLTLRDGRTIATTIEASPGSPEDPMTLEQLRAKWIDCLSFGRAGTQAHRAALAGELFDEGVELTALRDVRGWLERVSSL